MKTERSSKHYFLRYDLTTAGVEYCVELHPTEDIKRICGKNSILRSRGYPIGDFAIFKVNAMPDKLPGYIQVIGDGWEFEQ